MLITSMLSVSAQAPAACLDLSTNLSRGAESKNVLALQQFLAAKGYLKATPNGYFGPATFAAAKQYQASVGLPNSGAVLALTRAAIKKETCRGAKSDEDVRSQQTQDQSKQSTLSVGQSTAPLASTQTKPVPSSQATYYPRPSVSSLDKGTLFIGGTMKWNTVITGTSFSTASNTVYFRNLGTGRKYTIGSFQSPDGKTITLPSTLTNDAYSCGGSCKEMLPMGAYDVTVSNEGGESDGAYLTIKGFSISSVSGSLNGALRQNATSTRIGAISFSATVPFYVADMSVSIASEGMGAGTAVSGLYLKDELTGQIITSYVSSAFINENESKIIGIYGNISAPSSGTITGSVTVTINDFIGQKAVSFVSPSFLTSVSGF